MWLNIHGRSSENAAHHRLLRVLQINRSVLLAAKLISSYLLEGFADTGIRPGYTIQQASSDAYSVFNPDARLKDLG